jgi:hypothetical protein
MDARFVVGAEMPPVGLKWGRFDLTNWKWWAPPEPWEGMDARIAVGAEALLDAESLLLALARCGERWREVSASALGFLLLVWLVLGLQRLVDADWVRIAQHGVGVGWRGIGQ